MTRWAIALVVLAATATGNHSLAESEGDDALERALLEHVVAYHARRVPPHMREPELVRVRRLELVTAELVLACSRFPVADFPLDACVALATNLAQWESGLVYAVHAGDELGPGGERCLFQIHRQATLVPLERWALTLEQWRELVGLEPAPTRRCVQHGVKLLQYHAWRCGIHFEGGSTWQAALVYSQYHQPGACDSLTSGALGRAHNYRHVLAKLRRSQQRHAQKTTAGPEGPASGEPNDERGPGLDLQPAGASWVLNPIPPTTSPLGGARRRKAAGGG
jgi:hypothetical protein